MDDLAGRTQMATSTYGSKLGANGVDIGMGQARRPAGWRRLRIDPLAWKLEAVQWNLGTACRAEQGACVYI